MPCVATQVPAVDEIDIAALREKYRHERDRRLRPQVCGQFVKSAAEFSVAYEADPHTPKTEREPLVEPLDVVVLGGGFSGLMAGVHLRNAGVSSLRHVEHAADFGGVWYWNRYPGVQCDNDAYCYLPLLEETGAMPSKKFLDGHEIQQHCRHIGERYGLYESALFHTRVTSLTWDEAALRWRVATDRGDLLSARFVVMCGGPLNRPKLPGIPGIHNFSGKIFHTARWDYDYTGGEWGDPVLDRLADKRVAIVGTGATAIQAIPFLGRYAKHLTVLQRTPPSVDERPNPPTDPAWAASLEPGWQAKRQRNFHRAAVEGLRRGDEDLISDIWTEINRNLAAELDAEGWPELDIPSFMARREMMDFRVMERLRRRIEAIVRDRDTAEALKPWFNFNCKRPLSNNEYYATFNRPNVTLIDVSGTRGVERMTARGFVADGVEHEIDCLVCASGFEVTSDLDRRWAIDAIEGRDGLSLYAHWADGYRTFHGMMTHGFPNLFFTGYTQGGFFATTTEQFSRQGHHIAHIVAEAVGRGIAAVEPTEEAQDGWVEELRSSAIDISSLQNECTPGYFNNDGDQSRKRWYLGETYGPGWDAFQTLLAEWRTKGIFEGLLTIREVETAR
jgi:cation diffusion facilitator CzcD-associated flavoprotein CzcO